MAVYTVNLQQASGVGDVSLEDGTTLANLAVSAGRGPKGDGFTGGTYDAGTGKVTFSSNDGIGFETGDLRGDLTEPGPIGSVTPNTGAFTSLSTTGDAVVGGTVDGRDVASDGSKLDGIESNADVTDTANVTAAGALMDSELTDEASVKALDQGVATTDSPEFAGLSVDTDTLYVDSSNNRVGIGTSSPSEKLEVAGNQKIEKSVEGGSVYLDLINSYPPPDFDHYDETVEIKAFFAHGDGVKGASGKIVFGKDESYGGAGAGSKSSNLQFYTEFDEVLSEAMRIDRDGNVGIGTSSPGATLDVNGSLSKNSGSFKIDHPVKPDTHHLVHSFVEGPQADNLYRGKVVLVDGYASVNLDEAGRMTEGTFVALNGNVQCFTTNEDGWTQVRGKVKGNILKIEAQDSGCTDEVSWLVIGERHDQHMISAEWTDENGRVITEPAKENTQ